MWRARSWVRAMGFRDPVGSLGVWVDCAGPIALGAGVKGPSAAGLLPLPELGPNRPGGLLPTSGLADRIGVLGVLRGSTGMWTGQGSSYSGEVVLCSWVGSRLARTAPPVEGGQSLLVPGCHTGRSAAPCPHLLHYKAQVSEPEPSGAHLTSARQRYPQLPAGSTHVRG